MTAVLGGYFLFSVCSIVPGRRFVLGQTSMGTGKEHGSNCDCSEKAPKLRFNILYWKIYLPCPPWIWNRARPQTRWSFQDGELTSCAQGAAVRGEETKLGLADERVYVLLASLFTRNSWHQKHEYNLFSLSRQCLTFQHTVLRNANYAVTLFCIPF